MEIDVFRFSAESAQTPSIRIAATIVTITFCAAALAAFVPAWRALSLNPATILSFQ
jgi:ABC-type lipoprotein release transport system permease subunit